MRGGRPCKEATLWDGTRLVHPAQRAGLAEAISELWFAETYAGDGFYHPANGDVIIDGGANIGLFSIWMAWRNPKCRLIALEPFAENFACLQSNIGAANLNSVSVHQLALGREYGKGEMSAVGNRSLDHRLSTTSDVTNASPVSIVPLKEMFRLAHTDEIALVKMDIEGGEYDVFSSADSASLNSVRRFAIEYHDHLRPGTLDLIKRRLTATHHFSIRPSSVEGCGILFASHV
jgi:FkbM family methyltransferase